MNLLRKTLQLAPADDVGLAVHIRHLRPVGAARGTVVLVHGATLASGLWDIAVPAYSVMQALAGAGYSAWALDVRGYARSQRIADPRTSYAGLHDAVSDIGATAEHACTADGTAEAILVGGSWGSITAARYACQRPQRVRRLALMAPIFAMRNASWLADQAEPGAPQRIRRDLGTTRSVRREDLLKRWDAEIADADKEVRRDPRVLDALMADSLEAELPTRTGAFTVPNGTLFDLFEAFSGRPLYDPCRLTMPVLLVRGQHDATSTAADAALLLSLLGSQECQLQTISHAGHFVCAERAAQEFQRQLITFAGG